MGALAMALGANRASCPPQPSLHEGTAWTQWVSSFGGFGSSCVSKTGSANQPAIWISSLWGCRQY